MLGVDQKKDEHKLANLAFLGGGWMRSMSRAESAVNACRSEAKIGDFKYGSTASVIVYL